jgi:hypothetical protein
MNRTRVDDLHNEWMKDPKYRREYKALDEEFSLTAAMIEARSRASTLRRYARATGSLLRISFEPAHGTN